MPLTFSVFALGGVGTQIVDENLKELPEASLKGMTHQTLKTEGGIYQSERHDPIRLGAPFSCKCGFTLII